MQIIAKIGRLLEKKSGVSEKTGNPWVRQQVVLRIYRQNQDGSYTQTNESMVCDCTDAMIMQSPQFMEGTMCRASVFADAREYNGRVYQQNLMNGFMPIGEGTVPQVQQATAPQPHAVQATAPSAMPKPEAVPFPQAGGDLPF